MTTDILTYWRQFIENDLNYTPDSSEDECAHFDIEIPRGDSFFDANGEGDKKLKFCRSKAASGTGDSATNRRQISNSVNSWLDGSVVYGNSREVADKLRRFKNGLMKTSDGPDGPLLPLNKDESGNRLVKMLNPTKTVPETDLFAAGDTRANENPVLLSLHTLFVREHNRRAKLLPKTWSDEQRFQEARRYVIAHIQAITFNEYLPALLGRKAPSYVYNNTLNPQNSVFFSTVAFKYGHDEISGIITRYGMKGIPFRDGHMLLRDSYFFPTSIIKVGIDAYLRGASVNQQNALDAQFDEDIRTYLYGLSPSRASDLAAIDIQRARDHGLPNYNECRRAFGLSTCSTFSCITNDTKIIALLNQVYGQDNVTFLDPFVGGLLESKYQSSNLGALFTVSILEQLVRVRNADRYWYQKDGIFPKSELAVIEATKLSDIIKRNCDIPILPKEVFLRRNISAGAALGESGDMDTKYLIGIIIPSVIAAILIIIIIGMCFSNSKNRVQDNQLYNPLIVNDNN